MHAARPVRCALWATAGAAAAVAAAPPVRHQQMLAQLQQLVRVSEVTFVPVCCPSLFLQGTTAVWLKHHLSLAVQMTGGVFSLTLTKYCNVVLPLLIRSHALHS